MSTSEAALRQAGQDQLDRILPWWGQSGTLIRERFTVAWFKRHTIGTFLAGLLALWFLWGIADALFPYISAPFRWAPTLRPQTPRRPSAHRRAP